MKSCQFRAKECAISTRKQPPGGLPKNIVVWKYDQAQFDLKCVEGAVKTQEHQH